MVLHWAQDRLLCPSAATQWLLGITSTLLWIARLCHCSAACGADRWPRPSVREQLTSQVLVCQGASLGRVGQVIGGALPIEGGAIRADTVLERCARLLHSMRHGTGPGSCIVPRMVAASACRPCCCPQHTTGIRARRLPSNCVGFTDSSCPQAEWSLPRQTLQLSKFDTKPSTPC